MGSPVLPARPSAMEVPGAARAAATMTHLMTRPVCWVQGRVGAPGSVGAHMQRVLEGKDLYILIPVHCILMLVVVLSLSHVRLFVTS